MNQTLFTSGFLAAALVSAPIWTPLSAQRREISLTDRPWSGSVIRATGGPVIPIFDGWYDNPDGTYSLCFGYYTVNSEEDFGIPLGPNNFIEPSQYDGWQPDYFEHIPESPFRYRRRYCVFSVQVPESFGPEDRVVWTLQRDRAEPLSVPGWLIPAYRLDELESPGRGDTAPGLRLQQNGSWGRGRNGIFAGPVRARVGEPLELTVWVDHPESEVWVGWAKHQGPADVSFSEQNTVVDPDRRTATTAATFNEPGEYLLRVQSIDNPVAAFEFFCCWTNGYLEVSVE